MDIPMTIWKTNVPCLLQSGTLLHKWEDESNSLTECHFSVDRYGFFLTIREADKEPVCIDLANVTEVRKNVLLPKEGRIRTILQCSGPENLKDRVFTIVMVQSLVDVSYLRLCSSSSRVASEWVEGLQKLCNSVRSSNLSVMTMLVKLYTKATSMQVNHHKISVRSICKCFNCGKNYEKRILDGLQAMELPHEKSKEIDANLFTFEKFYQLYLKVCPRQDFDQIFTKWQEGKAPYITPNRLMKFLNTKQRDPSANEILHPHCTLNGAGKIISRYETCKEMEKKGRMSVDGFSRYLMSDENLCVNNEMFDVHQDMNQPISHYFINSSHNTYLLGRQIGGKSSVEIYRQCLLNGCRCIELDCWDGPGDEPVITHGKAMCTNVLFKDVIEAIKETAFVTSEYPVLLSFENHCSKYQQFKMACYCTEIFGDMLLSSPLDTHPLEENQPLPSPNHLKRKILIKNKKLRADQEIETDFESRRPSEIRLEDLKNIPHRMSRLCEDYDGEEAASKENENGFVSILKAEKTVRSSIIDETVKYDKWKEKRKISGEKITQPKFLKNSEKNDLNNGCINNEIRSMEDFDRMLEEQEDSDSVEDLTNILLNGGENIYPTLSKDKSTTQSASEDAESRLSMRKLSTTSSESTQSDEETEVKRSESFASFGSSVKIVQQRQNSQTSLSQDEMAEYLSNYHHSASLGNIHPSLSCLVTYTQPIPFPGFERSEERNLHYLMSSFNECAAFTLLKANPMEFVKYNQRQFSRIYPKGSRVDSSNYMPQVFWNAGSQLVALNLQTSDLAVQLNAGKFIDNGRSGYLLKPGVMRRMDKHFDPFTEMPVDGVVATCISIKVISGQFLSDKRVGTYVEVDLYGLPADTLRKKFKTKIINSNGMNPYYDSEEFRFNRIILPELALMRFTVLDDSDRVLGQRVLPLSTVQPGYRHIPLWSETSRPLPLSTLFCHITMNVYVFEGYSDFVDELSQPLKFKSAAEKRAEAIYRIFDFEEDYDEVSSPTCGSNDFPPNFTPKSPCPSYTSLVSNLAANNRRESTVSLSMSSSMSNLHFNTQLNRLPTPSESKLQATDVSELKRDKLFIKLLKKHQKDSETTTKRQVKERNTMSKAHNTALEKLFLSSQKNRENAIKAFERSKRKYTGKSLDEVQRIHEEQITLSTKTQQERVKSVLRQQADEWCTLISQQVKEEINLYDTYAPQQFMLLKKILDTTHECHLKTLEQRHERECSDLHKNQVKQSVETTKNAGKQFKCKEEKERMLRKWDKFNIKEFAEERQHLENRQSKEADELKAFQKKEKEQLDIYFKREMQEHKEQIKLGEQALRKPFLFS